MLKIAALAFMPISAITFGALAVALALVPGLWNDFPLASRLYFGAAALSVVIAAPAAWLAARWMLSPREKRRLDGSVSMSL